MKVRVDRGEWKDASWTEDPEDAALCAARDDFDPKDEMGTIDVEVEVDGEIKSFTIECSISIDAVVL